jgi:hypothetical protein
VAKIETWDCSKANIRVESQGTAKRADSVQRTVIEALLTDPDPYDVIFEDDGKGEIADVVALRITDSVVSATLFHCKYSGADTPGARLSDLYEVCGQAQKSARWRDRPNRMLQHMLNREQKRRDRGVSSRIEHDSAAAIKKLKAGWQDYRFEYDVRIVQPGLSRKAIGEEGTPPFGRRRDLPARNSRNAPSCHRQRLTVDHKDTSRLLKKPRGANVFTCLD